MTKRQTKRELARRIRRAVLALDTWKIETVGKARVLTTAMGELEILRTTPSAKLAGMPAKNGIDIWGPKGKVFSVWWNEPKLPGGLEHELEVVRCATGDWYAPLLAHERLSSIP